MTTHPPPGGEGCGDRIDAVESDRARGDEEVGRRRRRRRRRRRTAPLVPVAAKPPSSSASTSSSSSSSSISGPAPPVSPPSSSSGLPGVRGRGRLRRRGRGPRREGAAAAAAAAAPASSLAAAGSGSSNDRGRRRRRRRMRPSGIVQSHSEPPEARRPPPQRIYYDTAWSKAWVQSTAKQERAPASSKGRRRRGEGHWRFFVSIFQLAVGFGQREREKVENFGKILLRIISSSGLFLHLSGGAERRDEVKQACAARRDCHPSFFLSLWSCYLPSFRSVGG